MKPAFRVPFNNGKQHIRIYIANSPAYFRRTRKCHAYYLPAEARRKRKGLFGHVHFSEVTHELVAHELLHVLVDWMREMGVRFSERNEERLVLVHGAMIKSFWRQYERFAEK